MRNGVRGALTAWLALIALQTVATSGQGRISGFFTDVNRLISRALDPSVPAIGGAGAAPAPTGIGGAVGAAAARAGQAARQATTGSPYLPSSTRTGPR